MQITLDPLSKVGFNAILEDHGIEQAMRSCRAELVREYERSKDFRWYGLHWERAIQNHDFEAKWMNEHGFCHKFGYTYYADGTSLSGHHYG
jgi:hypothetical protein